MRKNPGSNRKRTRIRRLLANLLLVCVGLVVGLLMVEVCLRIAGYSYPNFYMPDPDRGIALRPSMEGWYRREGLNYVRINSDGLRDREHSKLKPADTLRIAVIGDSYAEALQVPMENAFWAVMEQRLQECPAFAGQKVEVINFGVSGYGTAQELITLRQHVWDYSPDIIMLAVTTNNDITDNSRSFKRTNIPYFIYRDGQLVLDDSFKDSLVFRWQQSALVASFRWARDHSRALQAIDPAFLAIKTYLKSRRARNNAAQPLQAQQNAAQFVPEQNSPAKYEEVGIDNLIYREPEGPVWNEAWQITEGLIVLMRDEVKSRGARFLVVTLSSGIQVHPDPAARQVFMKGLGVDDLFYPDRRIKALGEREGFAVLSLAPALRAYAEEKKVFLHGIGNNVGNGHWNILGHRVAGEIIAQKLCEGVAT